MLGSYCSHETTFGELKKIVAERVEAGASITRLDRSGVWGFGYVKLSVQTLPPPHDLSVQERLDHLLLCAIGSHGYWDVEFYTPSMAEGIPALRNWLLGQGARPNNLNRLIEPMKVCSPLMDVLSAAEEASCEIATLKICHYDLLEALSKADILLEWGADLSSHGLFVLGDNQGRGPTRLLFLNLRWFRHTIPQCQLPDEERNRSVR
jgi:hypothetical protein